MRLTELCSSGGCAAKYDGSLLQDLLDALPSAPHPDLLVGLDPPDDAAVMRLSEHSALVLTVDFFPPVVDTPFDYGRIAANNALNDVYAMGGSPLLALSIAAFPTDLPAEAVAAIVQGAAEQCSAAGAVLAGGHTIRDREPKFGLAVAGLVSPGGLWLKSGARPGDVVLITKPIGVGLLVTGWRKGVVSDATLSRAIEWMLTSNKAAAAVLRRFRPHAVTDVTGFGLLGHVCEVARLSRVRVEIDMASVPVLDDVVRCARAGIRTSAHLPNMRLVSDILDVTPDLEDDVLAIAVDPQTAGGLMVVVPGDLVDEVVNALRGAEVFVARIGRVAHGSGVSLRA